MKYKSLCEFLERPSSRLFAGYMRLLVVAVAISLLICVLTPLAGFVSVTPLLSAAEKGSGKEQARPSDKESDKSQVKAKAADRKTARPSTSGAVPLPPGSKVTVSGTVVDESGKPVHGAKVFLREWSSLQYARDIYDPNPHDAFANATTDDQGRFHFRNVESPAFRATRRDPSRWDVVALIEGHAVAWSHLPKADNEEPITLKFGPEMMLRGRLVDQSKQPVAGAVVCFEAIAGLDSEFWGNEQERDPKCLDLFRSELRQKVTTDGEGRFQLRGLPKNARVTVSIEHGDYQSQYIYTATTKDPQPDINHPQMVAIFAKEQPERLKIYTGDFELVLKPGHHVEGHVVFGDTGEPCPNAGIELSAKLHSAYTTADEKGLFQFSGQPGGELKVTATPVERGTYLTGHTEVTLDDNKRTTEFAVRLPLGQKITGTVIADETQQGVPGVVLTYLSRSMTHRSTGFTRIDGTFELVVSPGPGTITLERAKGDFYIPDSYALNPRMTKLTPETIARYRREIEVKEGQPFDALRFSIDRGAEIHGLVKDPDGKPVAGAEVTLPRAFGSEESPHTVKTGADGKFTIAGIAPNAEQRLEVVDQARQLRAAVLAKPDKPGQREIHVEIQLGQTATIVGRAVLDDKPLAGVKVSLYMHDVDRGERIGRPVGQTSTDTEGKYKFEQVTAGREYYVYVYRSDADFEQTEQVTPGPSDKKEMQLVKFETLDSTVAGVVVDPDGNPVEGAVVSARDRRTRRQFDVQFRKNHESITTDKQGRFTLKYLANVPLELMAYIPSPRGETRIRFPARVEAEAGQTDVRIILDPKLVRRK